MSISKYLVTGGAGFIGSNFIHFLLKRYDDITIINFDNLTYAGNLNNLSTIEKDPRYTFVKGDIRECKKVKKVFDQFGPDYVINFAAESHVDRSILHPDIFVRSNILGVQNLLQVSLQHGVTRFLQISTDEVYGSLGKTGKFYETTPLDPRSPYSASKASADLLTQAYLSTFNLPVNITRSSNNYGLYQFPEKLIPLTILNCLNGKKIPVYGDGLNVRDWIHVLDHARALDMLLQKGVVGEVYNIGVDNERSNIEITKMILKILGKPESLMEYVADRPGHDRRYAIDASKIAKLGWTPIYTKEKFEQGLNETVQWYKDNTAWVEKIRAKMSEINQQIQFKK